MGDINVLAKEVDHCLEVFEAIKKVEKEEDHHGEVRVIILNGHIHRVLRTHDNLLAK